MENINVDDYGDELWFGGDGAGLISVGEDEKAWVNGGCKKKNPELWSEMLVDARIVAARFEMMELLNELLPRPGENINGANNRVHPVIERWIELRARINA